GDPQQQQGDIDRHVAGGDHQSGDLGGRHPDLRAHRCSHVLAPLNRPAAPPMRFWAVVASCIARPASANRTPSRFTGTPATKTLSTLDVSMPHTTAPIGSLMGAILGRSVRSMTMSACFPTSSVPVTDA